mmetsp:Transcript_8818/g.22822  ORF Transcript_8818/g.22822 Transcript_8818/m.22822 type:complete len:286 (+) Transcript_8818:267-1124(+)
MRLRCLRPRAVDAILSLCTIHGVPHDCLEPLLHGHLCTDSRPTFLPRPHEHTNSSLPFAVDSFAHADLVVVAFGRLPTQIKLHAIRVQPRPERRRAAERVDSRRVLWSPRLSLRCRDLAVIARRLEPPHHASALGANFDLVATEFLVVTHLQDRARLALAAIHLGIGGARHDANHEVSLLQDDLLLFSLCARFALALLVCGRFVLVAEAFAHVILVRLLLLAAAGDNDEQIPAPVETTHEVRRRYFDRRSRVRDTEHIGRPGLAPELLDAAALLRHVPHKHLMLA